MRVLKILIIVLLLIPIYSGKNRDFKLEITTVTFPQVSEAIQITHNNKEHFYASYFGINSFSKSERYATVLETDIKYKLPDENDPATLGLVDLRTNDFIPLTTTRAWTFQQGCMAHWLGTSPDSLIIYNDYRKGKFVSIIMNVLTKKEIKVIPYPISAVSPNGKLALSLNFSRLRITDPDYGYAGGGQNPQKNVPFPKDDGLFLINLQTGSSKLLVSIDQVKDLVTPPLKGGIETFNHMIFNKDGSKVFFISRSRDIENRSVTRCLTVNTDGSNLQPCFPPGWEGSHFDFLNDTDLLITAKYKAKEYSHVLFTVGKDNYRRLGNGALDFDGHCSFSPNKKWMVTDTYPVGALREQKIYLLNMKSQAVLCLGNFFEPMEFSEGSQEIWRCDLHCRWSPKGDIIGFNSTHTGSRQAYIFRLKF